MDEEQKKSFKSQEFNFELLREIVKQINDEVKEDKTSIRYKNLNKKLEYLWLQVWNLNKDININETPFEENYFVRNMFQEMVKAYDQATEKLGEKKHLPYNYKEQITFDGKYENWQRATKGRGHKSYKAYVAVFVRLVTKAIHLEVVSDMTTDAFLAAFKRFTSRRGPCSHTYSDNGTNFVGASKVLQKVIKSIITDTQTQEKLVFLKHIKCCRLVGLICRSMEI